MNYERKNYKNLEIRVAFYAAVAIIFIIANSSLISGQESNFTSAWDTTKTSSGSSNNKQITLPLVNRGSYDFTVDWGDGNASRVTSWNSVNKTHTYATAGIYTISITGEINGFGFNNGGDRKKLINISSWGPLRLGNSRGYFWGAENLADISADDVNLSGTTDLSSMFRNAAKFNGDVGDWDTSKVTNMRSMFHNAHSFNQDINGWNVSKVTDMNHMLYRVWAFTQPLNNWDTSSVRDMSYMFYNVNKFNQPLNNWDVSNVRNMRYMFRGSDINHPLNNWNVSRVTDMRNMFALAYYFNQSLNNWDTSSVRDMSYMFYDAWRFNGDVSSWDTSRVTSMQGMFYWARDFNGNISDWDTGRVTDMAGMFSDASSFNQDLSSWEVCKVSYYGYFDDNASAWQNNYKPKLGHPCVELVTLAVADGTYRTGDTINLTIAFNGNVAVTGTPKLELEFDGANKNASYAGGNNTKKLFFQYTVQSEDETDNLNYIGENALTLNGGTIKNGNKEAILTLPTGAGSLTYNKKISVITTDSAFISTWDTTKRSSGSSNRRQITLPLERGGSYDFKVYWGDGSISKVTSWNSVNKTHTYAGEGVKTIIITGKIKGFRFADSGDKNKIINITRWGPLRLGNGGGFFNGASNLADISATDVNLSGTTNFTDMFRGASSFNGDISDWDTGRVTDMEGMFSDASSFNGNIGGWDTGRVTDMEGMFSDASSFNGNIGGWDTGRVTDMEGMFLNASSFNGNIGGWDTGRVTDMEGMFADASSFNQPLNNWDTGRVTDMEGMFADASSFNQPLNNWDTGRVTDMEGMFAGAFSFNQPLDDWDVSSVTNMVYMFADASSFNQPLNNWNTSKVTNMEGMFLNASSFNGNISDWDTSKVTDMRDMFRDASSFNQDLSGWEVCNLHYRFFADDLPVWQDDYRPKSGRSCVELVTSANSDGTYTTGDTINITITFRWNVVVTGTPKLELEFDGANKNASYKSGNDTADLLFQYTIKAGDRTDDLDYAGKNALTLNGGSIKDGDEDAVLTLPAGDGSLAFNKNIVVGNATPRPFVESVDSATADGTYGTGDRINVAITFSRAVAVTGMPRLELAFNEANRYALYKSGSGTDALTFEYVIEAGDNAGDLDYHGSDALTLNGGSIKSNNKDAVLTLPAGANSLSGQKNIVIDTSADISSFAFVRGVTSTNSDGTYTAGDAINIAINFSENVTVVNGTPKLELEFDGANKNASYAGGNNTGTLIFQYTIEAGDRTDDLNYAGADALSLDGGSIRPREDSKIVNLTLPAGRGSLSFNKNIKVGPLTDSSPAGISPSSFSETIKADPLTDSQEYDSNRRRSGSSGSSSRGGGSSRGSLGGGGSSGSLFGGGNSSSYGIKTKEEPNEEIMQPSEEAGARYLRTLRPEEEMMQLPEEAELPLLPSEPQETSDGENSRWLYVGLILLVFLLVVGGRFLKGRRKQHKRIPVKML